MRMKRQTKTSNKLIDDFWSTCNYHEEDAMPPMTKLYLIAVIMGTWYLLNTTRKRFQSKLNFFFFSFLSRLSHWMSKRWIFGNKLKSTEIFPFMYNDGIKTHLLGNKKLTKNIIFRYQQFTSNIFFNHIRNLNHL